MSIVKGPFQLTGSVKGYSFYTVAGSDRVIMRTKGGPKPLRMRVGKEFENVRKHQKEWAGAMLFSRGLRNALGDTYHLSNMNVSAAWCGMGKKIIGMDTVPDPGERPLLFSLYRNELENYSLNKNYTFNSILRTIPQYEVNKEEYQAMVKIPEFNSKMDLFNLQKLPYFRFIVSLGIVSNIYYKMVIERNMEIFRYEPELGIYNGDSKSISSDWFSTDDNIKEQTLSLQLEKMDPDFIKEIPKDLTILLGIGLQFGTVGFGGKIYPVKHACCGKIVTAR